MACCDFEMRDERLRKRLAALRAARPRLEREASARLLDLYRRDRKFSPGPLTALIGQQALFGIIARGEAEHRLGIAKAMLRLREFTTNAFRPWTR